MVDWNVLLLRRGNGGRRIACRSPCSPSTVREGPGDRIQSSQFPESFSVMKATHKSGVVSLTLNPSPPPHTGRLRQAGLWELEASLVYMSSSKPAGYIVRPYLKNRETNRQTGRQTHAKACISYTYFLNDRRADYPFSKVRGKSLYPKIACVLINSLLS